MVANLEYSSFLLAAYFRLGFFFLLNCGVVRDSQQLAPIYRAGIPAPGACLTGGPGMVYVIT